MYPKSFLIKISPNIISLSLSTAYSNVLIFGCSECDFHYRKNRKCTLSSSYSLHKSTCHSFKSFTCKKGYNFLLDLLVGSVYVEGGRDMHEEVVYVMSRA